MKGKKTATLSGVLMYSLSIGRSAVILHKGGITRTSRVVAIHNIEPSGIRFETQNTNYRLLLDPLPRAADCRLALGSAA